LHRASVAGGLSCLTRGAQTSLPPKSVIDGKLSEIAPPWQLDY
jgi:ribokinase